jgi:hypothetical protein
MKSRSIRVALLSAFVLVSPLPTFAGGQHLVRMPRKGEIQDRADMTPAVQQGKGGGMSRSQVVLRANAYRLQTEEDRPALRNQSSTAGPNRGDTAFRK